MKTLIGMALFMISVQSAALTIPMKKLPVTLDPQNYEDIYSMVAILQVHRGLMKFKANLEIDTDIAESYKVMEGGKIVRFILRERRFSDGTKVTADHVKYTMQRMFKNRSGFSADLTYIKGGRDILSGKKKVDTLGVHSIDERTVDFVLERPIGIFLSHLATVDMAILPLSADLKYDWKKSVGAGPYNLSSLEKNQLTLKRKDIGNKKYPLLVTLKEMTEPQAIASALSGEVDSLDGFSVPVDMLSKLQDVGWRKTVTTMTKQLFLVLNPKAISEPIRKEIQNRIMQLDFKSLPASYQKAFGIVPAGLSGALKVDDLQWNASHFVKGNLVELTMDIVDAEPVLVLLANQIKEELGKANIVLRINKISIEQYLDKIKTKKFDLMVRSKFLDYPDGLSILTYFRSQYVSNTFFVDSKKVDELLDKSMTEVSSERRSKLYKNIQKNILEQNTIVPLVFGSDNLGLWSNTVDVVPAHPLGIQGLPFDELVVKGVK